MEAFTQSFRHAWRRLSRNPGASLLAVLALGLGIGLVTTMFNSLYGVVLKGLPFEDSRELVHLEYAQRGNTRNNVEVPIHDYLDWQAEARSFEALGAFYEGTVNLADEGYPERYEGAFVTANVFDLLGVRPIHGRGFLPGEDEPGAEPVIVLGHDVWRQRYAADPGIIGRSIRVNGTPTTVVGVMAEGFRFPIKQDVWVPHRLDPVQLERGEGSTFEAFARLADNVSIGEATAEMGLIAQRLAAAYPESNGGLEVLVKPYAEEFIPDEISGLFITLQVAVGFVLLIACANVASLLLARASSRSKELATRIAIGAERRRVIWDLLAESLLLSTLGSLLGLGLAFLGGSYMRGLIDARPEAPYWVTPGMEWPVLAFVVGLTVVAGVLAGLVPALQAARMDVHELLKDEGRTASSFRIGRFSRFVVVGEIALACMLLLGAGLMTRSIVNLQTLDLGFSAERILTARLGLFEIGYPEEGDRLRFWEGLVERLQDAPGVVAAAATSSLPVSGGGGTWYRVEGKTYKDRQDVPGTNRSVVTPSFFDTFEIPVVAGRPFTSQDREGSEPVVIVNRSFAELEWPGEDPLRRRLLLARDEDSQEPWRTVVGVVPDAWMDEFDDQDQDGLYLPLAQNDRRFLSLAVKTRGDALAFTPTLRDTVLALDSEMPLYWVQTMERTLADQRFFHNFFGGLFATFGLAALVLAAVGIYGVTAFSVGQRTQEIGVRMALGAGPGAVLKMVLGQGAGRLVVGLAVGLGLSLLVSRLLAGFLFGVEPTDPVTFGGIALSLTVVTLLACLLPARRAMRVDPIEALRHD